MKLLKYITTMYKRNDIFKCIISEKIKNTKSILLKTGFGLTFYLFL